MDELIALKEDTLSQLPEGVLRPSYDRRGLTPGIVHIGLGNFHRAHQAWYLHRLMQAGLCHDWAIIGAGVRAGDAVQRERLLGQDCLTTLVELSPDGRAAEVTGPMIDFVPVDEDNASLIAQMADPAIRIVSLTVTEGGYYIDPAVGGFDEAHPDIVHDAGHPRHPRTAFGAMIEALRRRRDAGQGPFTIQSCDNLQGNGAVTRQTVLSLARMIDPSLAGWIRAECSFPNSMVDCIVPATGPEEIAEVRAFGIDDCAPVTHENFRQWVIQDEFCAGRPDWDKSGATFTDDVHDYESMKIRILNAGHQVLANPGELLSVPTIADCMAHPLISALFDKVQAEEITPYVKQVPDMTPEIYVAQTARRFSNPAIRDTTRRVAFDGASRHTGFVMPNLRDAIAAGGPVEGLALVEALWARMCEGTREDGTVIAPNDPQWDTLQTAARAARSRPQAWLEQRRLYGKLGQERRFADAFTRWLEMLWAKGTEAALEAYTGEQAAARSDSP